MNARTLSLYWLAAVFCCASDSYCGPHEDARSARDALAARLMKGEAAGSDRKKVRRSYEQTRRHYEALNSTDDTFESRTTLAEFLLEYAQFLAGVDYPRHEDQARVLAKNKSAIDRLLSRAQRLSDRCLKDSREQLRQSGTGWLRAANAELFHCKLLVHRALLEPRLPDFQALETLANNALEDYFKRHLDDVVLASDAMVLRGRCYYETALRRGKDRKLLERAFGSFLAVVEALVSDKDARATKILARAYYWFYRTLNELGDPKRVVRNHERHEARLWNIARRHGGSRELRALLEFAVLMQARGDGAKARTIVAFVQERAKGHARLRLEQEALRLSKALRPTED